jgi:hypothetical protein
MTPSSRGRATDPGVSARRGQREHADACARCASNEGSTPVGSRFEGRALLDVEQHENAGDDACIQEQPDNGDGVIGIALVRLCVLC